MTRFTAAAAFAAAALLSQPVSAADDPRAHVAASEQRAGAFAGARLRIPLGARQTRERPSAALQLGFEHIRRNSGAGSSMTARRGSALELRFFEQAKPTFLAGGTPVRTVERRLGVSTGGAIAIGAGVTLLVLIAVAAASGPPDDITP